jgi:hypothetical protein
VSGVDAYRFTSLAAVLILKLDWAPITESGVEPACVVDGLPHFIEDRRTRWAMRAARHLRGARIGLRCFFENAMFVCVAEPAPMALTRPRNDGACQRRGGISPLTKGRT